MPIWQQQSFFAFTNNNSLFSISVDSKGSDITSEDLFSDKEYHSSNESSDEDNSDDETTHTLAFKCIGAAHEKERQQFLKIASKKSKERKLQIKFRPESNNEKNKNDIATDINHGSVIFFFSLWIHCKWAHAVLASLNCSW